MSFLVELWAIIASSVVSWFSRLDNQVLAKISNLLSIFILVIGLIDYFSRGKRRKRAESKQGKQTRQKNGLEIIEGTQKPFKTVNMLNDPMATSVKIGTLIEKTKKMLGGKYMKKFFKWIWYNKEQLLSIAYNTAVIVLVNFLMWTDLLNGFFASFVGAEGILAIKIVAIVMSVLFAALTVRNVCVTYGLSSLDTIDKVLKEKAEAAERKLTPEQKQNYKESIAILKTALEKAQTELTTAETELAKITALHTADNSLVKDFVVKRDTYEKTITASKAIVSSIETKIAVYKDILNGKTTDKK